MKPLRFRSSSHELSNAGDVLRHVVVEHNDGAAKKQNTKSTCDTGQTRTGQWDDARAAGQCTSAHGGGRGRPAAKRVRVLRKSIAKTSRLARTYAATRRSLPTVFETTLSAVALAREESDQYIDGQLQVPLRRRVSRHRGFARFPTCSSSNRTPPLSSVSAFVEKKIQLNWNFAHHAASTA